MPVEGRVEGLVPAEGRLVEGREADGSCEALPRVDGRAFFRTIAPRVPTIARRLIFMTGDVAGTEAEEFLRESGCRWIPKPFRLRDLVRAAVDAAS